MAGTLLLALNLALFTKAKALGISESLAVRINLASSGVWWAVFCVFPLLTLRHRPAARMHDPSNTISRGPKRSDRLPHRMLPTAIARKPKVMALETPVMDHPVFNEMGRRKTGSENIAPIAMQPKRPPAATITQR